MIHEFNFNFIRRNWENEETLALLQSYRARRMEMLQPRKKKAGFGNILKDLDFMKVLKAPTTVAHLQMKMSSLQRSYQCAKYSESTMGKGTSGFQFMDAMDSIFGGFESTSFVYGSFGSSVGSETISTAVPIIFASSPRMIDDIPPTSDSSSVMSTVDEMQSSTESAMSQEAHFDLATACSAPIMFNNSPLVVNTSPLSMDDLLTLQNGVSTINEASSSYQSYQGQGALQASFPSTSGSHIVSSKSVGNGVSTINEALLSYRSYQGQGALQASFPSASGSRIVASKSVGKNEPKRANWTDNETRALLGCYGVRQDELKNPKKQRFFYKNILEDLVSMKVLNAPTTVAHVQSKMNSLMQAYKSASDAEQRTGSGSSTFLYMSIMDDILGDRPIIANRHTLNLHGEAIQPLPIDSLNGKNGGMIF